MAGRRVLAAILLIALIAGCQKKPQAASSVSFSGTRPPAAAGSFYPAEPAQLRAMVTGFLAHARQDSAQAPGDQRVVGILVPHAGYVFSGPTAAAAFKMLEGRQYDRVILLGPPHTMAVRGASVYCGLAFQTPLGNVPVDTTLARAIVHASPVMNDDPAPHAAEHSLEVELPFLQTVLENARIVPILVMGDSGTLDSVAKAIIDAVGKSSGGFSRTLLVVSSDLAHYPGAADAQAIDKEILAAFASLDAQKLLAVDRKIMGRNVANLACTMCGLDAAYVGLQVARAAGASAAQILDTRTSADAGVEGAGKESVVGYGSVVLTGPAGPAASLMAPLTDNEQAFLLRIARSSIEQYLKTRKPGSFTPPAGSAHLLEKRGCFVTLYEHGGQGAGTAGATLRGCIGMLSSDLPLVQLVSQMAVASAFEDPRFPPVSQAELANLSIEVSVYRTGIEPIASADDFKVGEEGIILRLGSAEATFLPQVATEQGWDRTATLENLSLKAGLDKDAWKQPDAKFFVYRTQVFKE
jgi:AmmeMemoRadiSam system protein B/AmmeMemoRadiSam system protein A